MSLQSPAKRRRRHPSVQGSETNHESRTVEHYRAETRSRQNGKIEQPGCGLFATVRAFFILVTVRDGFSGPLSRNDNMGGVNIMSPSTFVVLLALTFGQFLLLTFGLVVLWLAGEIGGRHE